MKKKLLMMTAGAVIGTTMLAGSVFAESVKVQKGHTLYNLSKKYDISVTELKKLNGLKSDSIHLGQTLKVSKSNTKSPTVKVPAKEAETKSSSPIATYTVKKGDTLFSISKKNGVSVANVQSYNNLKNNTIHIGQVLKLGKATATQPVKTPAPPATKPSTPEIPKAPVSESPSAPAKETVSTTSYVVKKGDTLSSIGRQFSVSYQTIKSWNGLTSDSIFVGQRLSMNIPTSSTPNITIPTEIVNGKKDRTQLISYAKGFMGIPYLWGGHSPSGFDCSGYIYYILKSQNLVSSRLTVAGYWSQTSQISNPQVGDLVFFENTYTSGPSHMGIYLGNGDFIHASSSNGISINNVTSAYWASHFLGYGTFY